jgi:hypothetical protein
MKPHVTLTLADVVKAGGVPDAIIKWAENDELTASGIIGSAVSGPGSGFHHGVYDFARRAIEAGAAYYIDAVRGKLIGFKPARNTEKDADGCWPEDTFRTEAGIRVRMGEWSENSAVRLECPSIADVADEPKTTAAAAEMFEAVANYHYPLSDVSSWINLLMCIRDTADGLKHLSTGRMLALSARNKEH